MTTSLRASVLFSTCAIVLGIGLGCRASHDEPMAAPADSAPTAVADGPKSASPGSDASERVVHITAKKFEYSPSTVTLKKGEPVVLELASLDRVHGFNAPDFKLRADVKPDANVRLRFVPDKAGHFEFHCDVFCGSGHEDMTGEIIVEE
jgi:cytochrome c oxidase subunit 2